jgi:hypothetical protein
MKALLLAASGVISKLIVVVAGLAVLYFFWGLVKFIFNAGSEEAQTEGKNIMRWGIIALFVMVSIWGLVRFVGVALNIPLNGSGGSLIIPEGLQSPCGGPCPVNG